MAIALQIGEIGATMCTIFDSVISRLRQRLRAPSGVASLALFVELLGLRVEADAFGRSSLRGKVIRISTTAPPETQRYQIARAACAYVLIAMSKHLPRDQHLMRFLSPHDLAVELFGVSASDEQVDRVLEDLKPPASHGGLDDEPLADVTWLFDGKRRERRGTR